MTDQVYLQKINGNPGFVDGATIPPFASKAALDASGSGWEIGTIANAAGVPYSWRGAGVGWVIAGDIGPGSPSAPFTSMAELLAALPAGPSDGVGGTAWYMESGVKLKAEWRFAWRNTSVSARPKVNCLGGHLYGLGGEITATAVDSRKSIWLARNCSTIRLYYRGSGPNRTTLGDSNATADASVSAFVELVTGEKIPVTFNGSRKGRLTGGGGLLSDPIFIGFRSAAYQLFVRSRAEMDSGAVAGVQSAYQAYEGVALNGPNLTNGTGSDGYTTGTGAYMFAPAAVLTDNTEVDSRKSTFFIGDSIVMGIGDVGTTGGGYPGRWGWAERVCAGVFPGWVSGYGGGTVGQFNESNVPLLMTELSLFSFDRAVIAFGANDCIGRTTVVQINALKSDFINAFNKLQSFGISRIYVALILPRTTSTDGFVTTANQTPLSGFGAGEAREAMNAWFLAGADGYVTGVVDTLTGVASGAVWLGGATTDGAHPVTATHVIIAENAAIILNAT